MDGTIDSAPFEQVAVNGDASGPDSDRDPGGYALRADERVETTAAGTIA